jgi:hypothetical protein
MAIPGLGLAFNQKDAILRPGGPKSINDCWVVAAEQVASAVGGVYAGAGTVVLHDREIADIPTFRKFAGKPDVNGPAGAGSLNDIEKGIRGTFPDLVTYQTNTFATFVAKARAGMVGALIVDASKLSLQYGFAGIHAISARCVVTVSGETWYHINTLQPDGSRPIKIKLSELKAAFLGAVLVRAPDLITAPPIEPVPPPAPQPPPPPPVDTTPYSADDLQAAKRAVKQAAINALNNLDIGG